MMSNTTKMLLGVGIVSGIVGGVIGGAVVSWHNSSSNMAQHRPPFPMMGHPPGMPPGGQQAGADGQPGRMPASMFMRPHIAGPPQCMPDVNKYKCSEPNDAEKLKGCLKEHTEELSPPCRAAMRL
jgi:hypothetical protein